jgi:hypothetical protein
MVLAQSDLKIYEGSYSFEEFPLAEFPIKAKQDALAVVRDNEVWSQLIYSDDASKELFKVFPSILMDVLITVVLWVG